MKIVAIVGSPRRVKGAAGSLAKIEFLNKAKVGA
jgi:hypothetical protein